MLALAVGPLAAQTSRPASQPAPPKVFVVVFDFATEGGGDAGVQLADSVRLRLARHNEAFAVIDRLTTQEISQAQGAAAGRKAIEQLMKEQLSAQVALVGTVSAKGAQVQARIRCIDLRAGAPGEWTQSFSDDTERAKAVVAQAIVEKLAGAAEWRPPEYGRTPEPRNFAKPLNANGDFEQGPKGWTIGPDNVSTFIEKDSKDRGSVLRMKNDLARDPWLEYRRDLMMGKADASKPPSIAKDTSYNSVAGLEGADYISDFFNAYAGTRYWLLADGVGPCSAKIFIKGWQDTPAARDGLSETALAQFKLTPEQFAELPEARRKELIDQDAARRPDRYLREVWRWQLTCGQSKEWKHWAEPFPPRGGMPRGVEQLHIKILSYWPPGETRWDNVFVYKDPAQTAPLPEEKARTPKLGAASSPAPAAARDR